MTFNFANSNDKLTKWTLHGYSSVSYTKVLSWNGKTLRETGRLEGSIYWRVGKRANEDFLAEKRAAYGQRIIATLSDGLVQRYSDNFSEKNLRRMMQFASVFSDEQIVVSPIRQLSWTHFIALIPLKSELQREFYLELCKAEAWNVKTLREKINSMLYERTAISKRPDELIKQELQALREAIRPEPLQ